MLNDITGLLKAGLDLIYPRTCAGCGVPVVGDERGVCWDCRAAITVVRFPYCSVCGRTVEGAVDQAYACHACSEEPPAYVRARSAVRFEGAVKRMVHDFKYREALWLEGELTDWLETACEVHLADIALDMVVPVPLHAVKLRERGFNQAALLASGLARRIGLGVDAGALQRTRATDTQTHLTGRERAHNVKGAFRARSERVRGRHLLLVDDVMTTGATLNECARALVGAGAAEVYVMTLARGGW